MQAFNAKAIAKDVQAAEAMVVIAYDATVEYMPAMTVPFHSKVPAELVSIREAQWVSLLLRVNSSEIVRAATTSHRPT